jgi:glyoxylase-like metal-dependent hydrolase (beta-lactamase superfamily II)
MAKTSSYTRGLHEVGVGCWAWLQPDGSWGWSNAGLVTGAGQSLLVDTLFDLRLTREMLAAMRKATAAAERIDVLVNTHANGDHCYGNELALGAEIVASEACAEEMGQITPEVMAMMLRNADAMGEAGAFLREAFGPFDFEGIRSVKPTQTFRGSQRRQVGDVAVELLEVGPAHTRGDVIVHVPAERLVYTGDILFIDGHPIIWEGPIGNWIRACDAICAMDPLVVVPGHGPLTDVAGVRRVRDYLAYIRDEARRRYDAGLGIREAARDISLADYEGWGDAERIAVNVATLYREFGASEARSEAKPSEGSESTPGPGPLELFGWMAELRRDRRGRRA